MTQAATLQIGLLAQTGLRSLRPAIKWATTPSEALARRVIGVVLDADIKSRKWLKWEKACIKRAVAGDSEALGDLYRAFARPLYSRVLMPKLGDATAAEDALSETFRTAIEKLDRFQPKGVSIWFWLRRIAQNKATDMHRVKGRTGRALTNFESLLKPIVESAGNPGTELSSAQTREKLKGSVGEVLDRLNPRYRRAIELRFFQERGRVECAELMEVKLGTFDVVLLRALRAFRKSWLETFGAPPEEA